MPPKKRVHANNEGKVGFKEQSRRSVFEDITNVVSSEDSPFQSFKAAGELDFRNSTIRRRTNRFSFMEIDSSQHSQVLSASSSSGRKHFTAFGATRRLDFNSDTSTIGPSPYDILQQNTSTSASTEQRSFTISSALTQQTLTNHRPFEMQTGLEQCYKHIEFAYNDHLGSDNEGTGNDAELAEDSDNDDRGTTVGMIADNSKQKRTRKRPLIIEYMDEGDATYTCHICDAKMWYNERVLSQKNSNKPIFTMCCHGGKVKLPKNKEPPSVLYDLFFDKNSVMSKNFHSNIRSYNNMFAFTSMGGKINHCINNGNGPYTFVLSGLNYHHIGSLLPEHGAKPVYSQLYIYDTENEVQNRISAVSKHLNNTSIDPTIVASIMNVLDEFNPFVKQYRMASAMLNRHNSHGLKLRLISSREHDGRTHNLPSASEVAALIVGDIDINFQLRDIIVEELSGTPQRLNELHPSYLPLQYPLLFPRGEDGYRDDIPHFEDEQPNSNKSNKRVSMREYFLYKLMDRGDEVSIVLHAGRLFQQYVVDAYTMIEAQRLLWVRTHQKELRADMYQGLSDALFSGERSASATGKRIVLPSSFTGGARYMIQAYQDAMTICRFVGFPDLFITFTCNPSWPEISRYCQNASLSPANRADILSRIFRLKLRALMNVIKKKKIFGKIRAEVYTIEFQKRGLPHAHILIWLAECDKIKDPVDVDNIISAEIPDVESNPQLYELVQKFMMHSPCGHLNPKAQCMVDKKCKKFFPKKFNEETIIDQEGFPTYRRREDRKTIEVKGILLDNRFVVPYNPTLLSMFHAHINVEKCNQSTAIKYLFKYISKGNDRVVASIYDNDQNGNSDRSFDEIQQYYNFRYISACEAAWRIFGFDIHHRFPPVERLSFHLPDQQYVIYSNTDDVAEILDKPRVCESMFLAWMKQNKDDTFAKTLYYYEFPQYYVYHRRQRIWKKRKRGFAIGRLTHTSPSSGELYYLRILLTKVKGPSSYEAIRTVDGVVHPTYRSTCIALRLLDDDTEFISALKEASLWATGCLLRRMFVSMLLCSCLSRPEIVWKETSQILSEDLLYISRHDPMSSGIEISSSEKEEVALTEIESLLQLSGKSISDFSSLPMPSLVRHVNVGNHLIRQELNYDKLQLAKEAVEIIKALNSEQKAIYDSVMLSLNSGIAGFFFVYGYGGTGKTFLWSAFTSQLRSKGEIVLTVASSGIAATLLQSGRTAHSRFAIPIAVNEDSMCNIKQNSNLAELIKATKLIIWDEAPMVQRFCFEAFDRTLKDIMHCNKPFGGKTILMGGDFRQLLPVIPKGSRATIVNACITSSYLWDSCTIFQLNKNMRLSSVLNQDKQRLQVFSEWLLALGDGKLGLPHDGIAEVDIPEEFLIKNYEDPLHAIVSVTYPGLLENLSSSDYFNDRAILCPTIESVNHVNEYMCSLLPGELMEYLSCDTICKSSQESEEFEDLYTTEFLNKINCSGLPMHSLNLKVGVPVMLLRNIDQSIGLCNGTRLRITLLGKNVIEAITLNGSSRNQKVLLHRMDMNPSDTNLPFQMKRRQFPIALSFAMTINKSQGQSLQNVGLYLSKPVFTHGQLYVAISRVKDIAGLKILIHHGSNHEKHTTTNVVYKEIFRKIEQYPLDDVNTSTP